MDFSKQYSRIEDSVVRIVTPNISQPNSVHSIGSGVVIGSGQFVLTCSHCIIPSAKMSVMQNGATNIHSGNLVYNNPTLDIAIFEFPQNHFACSSKIIPSDNVLVGHECFAVGFPGHSNDITALSSHIAGFESYNGNEHLKIDSSVNHGNSGGPLFDSNGNLIGIINQKKGQFPQLLEKMIGFDINNVIDVGGMNHTEVLRDLASSMKTNLNVGVGLAIPTSVIAKNSTIVKDIMNS